MKYSDLISFDPIESTIQLIESKDKQEAARLVRTYVMSDRMAENLTAPVIDQLQYDVSMDNKGVLIVGNYGTGKSHLMSLLSAIANDEENLQYVKNQRFADDVKRIAGKFEVLRMEIGGVTMPLRDIICTYIEDDFAERGIDFKMPDLDTVIDNKALIRNIMMAFDTKYPGKGYMIIIDELLAYLETRNTAQVTLDLEFLRAIGEMCGKSRIRIIIGLQEKIFDNPRFSYVSDKLRHVSDRFTQLIITKEDTAYVVKERILKKDAKQKAQIRNHLQKFSALYEGMGSNLEEYVDMFPIHPAYIDVFTRLYVIEQRHVLKNVSETIRNIFSKNVPDNEPGIISFDDYWPAIKNNGLLKSDPTIREVVDVSNKLENIIDHGFTKKIYKPMAIQIIYALSVHRLTTGDLSTQFGMTPQQLKNELCLYLPLPEMDETFLQGAVNATLKEILSTVTGQFIVHNTENDQYYIDVTKIVDYDERIAQRAELVTDDELNRYFYQLVYASMEWQDKKQYVTNFNIYEYELNWVTHNIYRSGYLFMGLPGERSTAQPERDFYIHFMPPYGISGESPAYLPDEVYFYFRPSDSFTVMLRLLAAADMLSLTASNGSPEKTAYINKAKDYRRLLIKDINATKNTACDVDYNHNRRKVIEALGGKYKDTNTFKDVIEMCASSSFDSYFNQKYPEFPVFQTQVTSANLNNLIREGINHYAGQKTQLSEKLLRSFSLLDENGKIRPDGSKYAGWFIEQIKALPPQSVLNFSDLFYQDASEEYYSKKYNISYWFCPIILLSLVYAGHAVITLRDGSQLTAAGLDQATKLNAYDCAAFKYISRPTQSSLAEIKKLLEVIGLNPVSIDNPNDRDTAIASLMQTAQQLSNKAVLAKNATIDFSLWNETLVTSTLYNEMRTACDAVRDEFSNYSAKYNTYPKLSNFSHSIDEVEKLGEQIHLIDLINEYVAFKNACTSIVSYLSNIEGYDLGAEFNTMLSNAKDSFRKFRDSIASGTGGDAAANSVKAVLEPVKDRYIGIYLDEHKKKRLDFNETKRQGEIREGAVRTKLDKLKTLNFLPTSKYNDLNTTLSNLKPCYELTPEEMKTSHICPHCRFSLGDNDQNVYGKLDYVENGYDDLLSDWTQRIIEAVDDPTIADQKQYLSPKQQAVIDNLLSTRALPSAIDDFFIGSINAMMQNIEPLIIDKDELIDKLENLSPMDVTAFKAKLNQIIDAFIAGRDTSNIRIIVKNSEDK